MWKNVLMMMVIVKTNTRTSALKDVRRIWSETETETLRASTTTACMTTLTAVAAMMNALFTKLAIIIVMCVVIIRNACMI